MSVQNLNAFGKCLFPTDTVSLSCGKYPVLSPPVDPFADEDDPLGSTKDVGSQQNYIHIRIQQRNGRKTLTTLQGVPKGTSTHYWSWLRQEPDGMYPFRI